MKYSDKDMEALISEVEVEFKDHLNKSEDTETPVVEASSDLKKSEDTETPVVEVKAQENDLNKSEDQDQEDSLDYNDEDITEMKELYSSMTKAEAEAHYNSVKAILFTDDSKEEEVMAKSEDEEIKEEDNDLTLLKSELEVSKQETETLKKSVGDLVAMLHKNVKTDTKVPAQKAITEIQYMAKSEDEVVKKDETNEVDIASLSKGEIKEILTKKIRSNDLAKSDRERINAFYLSETNIDSIKDLIGG